MWPFKKKEGKSVRTLQREATQAVQEAQPVIAESRKNRNENHVYLLIREALR